MLPAQVREVGNGMARCSGDQFDELKRIAGFLARGCAAAQVTTESLTTIGMRGDGDKPMSEGADTEL